MGEADGEALWRRNATAMLSWALLLSSPPTATCPFKGRMQGRRGTLEPFDPPPSIRCPEILFSGLKSCSLEGSLDVPLPSFSTDG